MGKLCRYQQKMKNGDIYVFECENEYVPELKQSRKKNRKLLGKLDADGNIIPTRKKSTSDKSPKANLDDNTILDLKMQVTELEKELTALKTENCDLRETNTKILDLAHKFINEIESIKS